MSLEEFNKILYSRARKKCVAAVAYVVDYPTDAIVAAVKTLSSTALLSASSDACFFFRAVT